MKKIVVVVGTRPNFIKITQFEKAFKKYGYRFEFQIIHTGQHYDANMSDIFFNELELKKPDMLKIEKSTSTEDIGNTIIQLSRYFQEQKPDLVIVVGDVNSTLAGAIAANKNGIKIAHLEAGLRSYDREMPEEINREITDLITDYFFVTEPSGLENLVREGRLKDNIFQVGNTMIDTLVNFDAKIELSDILERFSIRKNKYALITMHRPKNVDILENLKQLIGALEQLSAHLQIVFPIHPRTKNKMEANGLLERVNAIPNLILLPPTGYLDFQKLIKYATVVVTDSGGIQEETTFRGIPCLTIRENTERPVTISVGTNELIEFDVDLIVKKVMEIIEGKGKKGEIPHLWDGAATERIVDILANHIFSGQ